MGWAAARLRAAAAGHGARRRAVRARVEGARRLALESLSHESVLISPEIINKKEGKKAIDGARKQKTQKDRDCVTGSRVLLLPTRPHLPTCMSRILGSARFPLDNSLPIPRWCPVRAWLFFTFLPYLSSVSARARQSRAQ